MPGHIDTGLGEITIDKEVIARYAGSVVVESFGIVGMAMVNVKDGIVKLLSGDTLTKGVKVIIKENRITLDFHIIISYGSNIRTITENLINNVKYKVEEFCNMKIDVVNIYVEGVKKID